MSTSDDIVRKDTTMYDQQGRTRIPKPVRDELGLEYKDRMEMVVIGDQIVVTKVEDDD